MANILIYDLTSSHDYGLTLGKALKEIGNYRQVKVQPQPGVRHSQVSQRAMDLVHRYYDARRDQVNAGELLDHFTIRLMGRADVGEITRPDIFKYQRVFLLDQDIHTNKTNWVFGFFQQRGPLKFLISSKSRMTSDAHAYDHLVHELGHMYGAPSPGRENTTMHLGLHCTNKLCVMQQRDTVASAKKYVEQRLRAKATTFCQQCRVDLILAGVRSGNAITANKR